MNQFLESRNHRLEDFNKRMGTLKQDYSQTLSAAINESDPASQSTLISKIQELNSQMTEEIRDIISILSKTSSDEGSIEKLNEELIKYQKDYDEIQKSQDKLTTLKLIKNTTSETLEKVQYSYWIYLGVLILLCFLIAFQVLKLELSSMVGGIRRLSVLK